ncbi:fumarylacetoacetate hydrolase family protein [Bacillus velezensis]|uniref:fumarylacetoacetate hydrolase family protein n=1 Tax=Bacillus velezensis TaxID=492670 RepID=UPI000F8D08C5|nr:fumarylacetoacetate hydrolase family protein [Bacillus velezensis]RUR98111.1 5-carboxymethyl-2-oxo-hex-3- ene-1,7-dioate decarboxylase [Bacillus velezensis]
MTEIFVKFRDNSFMTTATFQENGKTIIRDSKEYDLKNTVIDAPEVGTVYGVALNMKQDLSELGDSLYEKPYQKPPKAPVLYIKPQNTVTGPNAFVPMPPDTDSLSMGPGLGVVIGKTACRVQQEDALDYVSGYTIVNDISIPNDSVFRPAVSQKCRDSFCPIGPWITSKSAIQDPNQLTVSLFINGTLEQEYNTSGVIRSVPKLIADVTEFMTLSPGDVLIACVPLRSPSAKRGDSITIQIPDIGSLHHTIIEEGEEQP